MGLVASGTPQPGSRWVDGEALHIDVISLIYVGGCSEFPPLEYY